MLLFRNSPISVSIGSALPHLETMKGDMRIELNPHNGNSGRSVQKYITRCASSNPRMNLFTDHANSEGEAVASASPMRLRRTLSLSDGNFSASTCRNYESAQSSSLRRLNTSMVSHPSLDEVSKLDVECLENPVENSISAQQIQERDLTSISTPHSLGLSFTGMKGEESDGNNVQVTSTNITEFVDSFVETLHENYPVVSRENEDYKHSTLQLGPNGQNCEAADDLNFKSSTNMYYQRMLEANPGNPLLLSNYAKFLYEVQHDLEKAEEYYGRAILASPGDAEVLSLYAKFTWETHKDAPLAEAYFDQAVKAAPDDCYVLSSYAHFLWDCEEEEEEENRSYGPADMRNEMTATWVGSVSAAA